MKYAKFSDDFLSYFRLDDSGKTLVLTDKRGYTRAVKLLPCEERPQEEWLSNGEIFKQVFGLYATEVWSMSEDNFLKWLNQQVPQFAKGDET